MNLGVVREILDQKSTKNRKGQELEMCKPYTYTVFLYF